MVQYGPITDIDRLALEALAGDLVVVAPSDDLEPDEIVATAWLHKLALSSGRRRCTPGLRRRPSRRA